MAFDFCHTNTRKNWPQLGRNRINKRKNLVIVQLIWMLSSHKIIKDLVDLIGRSATTFYPKWVQSIKTRLQRRNTPGNTSTHISFPEAILPPTLMLQCVSASASTHSLWTLNSIFIFPLLRSCWKYWQTFHFIALRSCFFPEIVSWGIYLRWFPFYIYLKALWKRQTRNYLLCEFLITAKQLWDRTMWQESTQWTSG